MKRRILLIGLGSLGQVIREASWIESYDLIPASRTPRENARILDITDSKAVADFFRKCRGLDLVINAAAQTDVDRCEEKPQEARAANALGIRNLSVACAKVPCALLHFSTNYVFSGLEKRPYGEKDLAVPRSIYGLTKLEGEFYALSIPKVSAVVRTSWIFGGQKRDFVHHFLEKFRKKGPIPCVVDQAASLTYVQDLAEALRPIVEKRLLAALDKGKSFHGIYHVSNNGRCTRYKMLSLMKQKLGKKNRILKLRQVDFKAWRALRPREAVLSTSFYEREFGNRLRPWQEALREYLEIR